MLHGHARLASGWWSSLAGRDSNPLGPFVKFQPSVSTWHPPHPGLAWRTGTTSIEDDDTCTVTATANADTAEEKPDGGLRGASVRFASRHLALQVLAMPISALFARGMPVGDLIANTLVWRGTTASGSVGEPALNAGAATGDKDGHDARDNDGCDHDHQLPGRETPRP